VNLPIALISISGTIPISPRGLWMQINRDRGLISFTERSDRTTAVLPRRFGEGCLFFVFQLGPFLEIFEMEHYVSLVSVDIEPSKYISGYHCLIRAEHGG